MKYNLSPTPQIFFYKFTINYTTVSFLYVPSYLKVWNVETKDGNSLKSVCGYFIDRFSWTGAKGANRFRQLPVSVCFVFITSDCHPVSFWQKRKQNKKIMIADFNILRDRLCYRITSGKMILGKLSQELASEPFHQHS